MYQYTFSKKDLTDFNIQRHTVGIMNNFHISYTNHVGAKIIKFVNSLGLHIVTETVNICRYRNAVTITVTVTVTVTVTCGLHV